MHANKWLHGSELPHSGLGYTVGLGQRETGLEWTEFKAERLTDPGADKTLVYVLKAYGRHQSLRSSRNI